MPTVRARTDDSSKCHCAAEAATARGFVNLWSQLFRRSEPRPGPDTDGDITAVDSQVPFHVSVWLGHLATHRDSLSTAALREDSDRARLARTVARWHEVARGRCEESIMLWQTRRQS